MTKTKRSKPHGNRYPWASLFDSNEFTLYHGIDYFGLSHGMASTVRQAAARHGVGVCIQIHTDRVVVEVSRDKVVRN